MPCDTVTITAGGGGGTGELEVQSVSFNVSEVDVGTTATAYFTVANNTSSTLSEPIPVYVDGNEAAAVDVQVDPGGSKEYEVQFTVPDTDSVRVSVGSSSSTINVVGGSTGGGGGGGDTGSGTVDKAITFAKENPMIVGAGAIGVGLLISNGDSGPVYRRR